MKAYNPAEAPPPEEWLELTAAARVALVERYHKKAGPKMSNRRAHAAIHAAVENHAARGTTTPVQTTITRLMAEGLDRHEAVHAVGAVLAQVMRAAFTSVTGTKGLGARYVEALGALRARDWLRGNRS
ncbi:hypothetical protein JXA88_02035 [Candidatus Fermentibacteria bacterium]|nr:hypothetical protein [Candidatus Fermentibacteria bacterium]